MATICILLSIGLSVKYAQLSLPLKQFVGLDPDFASLATHRLNIARIQGISDALPFGPNQFDLIFSSWVMEHLERPLLTLQSIHHCLKPGGVYIFITPNQNHPLAQLNLLFGKLGKLQGRIVEMLYKRKEDDTFPTFYRANSSKRLGALCHQSNLQIHTLDYIPDPTYLAFSPLMYQASCLLEDVLPTQNKIHLVGIIQKPMNS